MLQAENEPDTILSKVSDIKVNGGHVWSQLLYTKANSHKIPVLVLHGGPGGDHVLLKWGLQPLAAHFPIIFYDQIGGGFSHNKIEKDFDMMSLWTIQNFVNQVRSVIDFYGLKEFVLLGSSWGCTLALEYFFSAPKNPKPIAIILNSPLVSTKLWTDDAELLKKQMPAQTYETMVQCQQKGQTESTQYYKAMIQYYNKHVVQKHLLSQDQLLLFNSTSKIFNREAYYHMWGPSEFYASGTLCGYDRVQELGKIDVPVLFTCGEFDQARPETVRGFHERVQGSEFVVCRGASHCAYFQDAGMYRPIVRGFYERVVGKIGQKQKQK